MALGCRACGVLDEHEKVAKMIEGDNVSHRWGGDADLDFSWYQVGVRWRDRKFSEVRMHISSSISQNRPSFSSLSFLPQLYFDSWGQRRPSEVSQMDQASSIVHFSSIQSCSTKIFVPYG
jgi:hypothetical protein